MSEQEILRAALQRRDPAGRAAYLDGACGGDAELRRRVEDLLRSHDGPPTFALPANDVTRTSVGVAPDGVADEIIYLDPSDTPGALGRLDGYEVMQVIGRGGMGVVFRAIDPALDRPVALKVVAPQLAASSAARQRFAREAKTAAAVSHEHIVGIYAVKEFKGLPYLEMEYVRGESLQERIDRRGPASVEEVLRVGSQIASGLAAAHERGLVHRDIKPANVLLHEGDERVKITDFGLARAVDDASVTQSGVIAGTPLYMSPEQARGDPVDHRTDLFSLGSVLYALCTGRPPFRSGSTVAVLKHVSEESPPSLREINSNVPDWLSDIVAKLHAKAPAERFQTAKEVAELLGQHLSHLRQPSLVPLPPRVTPPARPRKWSRNWIVALGGIALIMLFGCCGVPMLIGLVLPAVQKVRESARPVTRIANPVGSKTGLPVSVRREGPAAGTDEEAILGDWRAESFESGGVKIRLAEPPLVDAAKITLTFRLGRVQMKRVALAGGALPADSVMRGMEGNYFLNTTITPRRFFTDVPMGAEADNFSGIYRLEGDRLTICHFLTDGKAPRIREYPTEFAAARGGKTALWVFKREALRDEDRLQGSWKAVSGEREGEKLADAELGKIRFTFTGNKVKAAFPGGGAGEGTFTINPTAEPRQIIVKAATENNQGMEGIYRFEDDRLTICMGAASDERPATFATTRGNPRLILVTFAPDPATRLP